MPRPDLSVPTFDLLADEMPARVLSFALAGLAASAHAKTYLSENFSGDWEKRWVVSDWKKEEGEAGSWSVATGDFYGDAEADKGAPRAPRRGRAQPGRARPQCPRAAPPCRPRGATGRR